MEQNISEKVKVALDLITAAVKANCNPVAIYLFGSYAYGTPHADSDLDIFVVVPDEEAGNVPELCADIRSGLYKKMGMPMDLLIGKQSSFEWRKKELTLERTVIQQGIKLYGN
ncbi:MAG: nucleotidyltransferase domain-containing protein [Tannerellaceae bacterium]|jgi:predicted nucleotidyltransferase|nr:nucleotidyltransferase domain-containing protein [Tannerellaceae bacterium]